MGADSGKNGGMDSSFQPGTELLRHAASRAGARLGQELLAGAGQQNGAGQHAGTGQQVVTAPQNGAMSLRAKWTLGGIVAGGAAAAVLGAGSSALALYFARRVLTPARVRVADQEVLAVIRQSSGLQVILAATPETTQDGTYSLFFDGGKGHARIGRIISYSPAARFIPILPRSDSPQRRSPSRSRAEPLLPG